MALRLAQLEELHLMLKTDMSEAAIARALNIHEKTVNKYRNNPLRDIPSSKEWSCVADLANKNDWTIDHLIKKFRERSYSVMEYNGLVYVAKKDAKKFFVPDIVRRNLMPLREACEQIGVSYDLVSNEYMNRYGVVQSYREGSKHLVDPKELRQAVIELGIALPDKDPAKDLITLPEAARILGEDPKRLSQLAYEKRITTKRFTGTKRLVMLEQLKRELQRLPPKKKYPLGNRKKNADKTNKNNR